jgi:hypothetical protein
MAESTTSVEPADGAEKATAAKPDASEARVCGKAGSRQETPLRGEAGHGAKILPQDGEQVLDELPLGAGTPQ